MGSILTKDVGKYEIWAGNPAKLIRKRFKDGNRIIIDKSCWWNMNDEVLKRKAKKVQ